MTKIVHAHKMVMKTARDMAEALFDELMLKNESFRQVREQWPHKTTDEIKEQFIDENISSLLEPARATLAQMLSGPLAAHLKDEIHDALVKDNALRHGPSPRMRSRTRQRPPRTH